MVNKIIAVIKLGDVVMLTCPVSQVESTLKRAKEFQGMISSQDQSKGKLEWTWQEVLFIEE